MLTRAQTVALARGRPLGGQAVKGKAALATLNGPRWDTPEAGPESLKPAPMTRGATMAKKLAYEPARCLVCGQPLEHKATGRPRRFCSPACKQRDYREHRKWARAAVDAALAGEPEPAKGWRYETAPAGG